MRRLIMSAVWLLTLAITAVAQTCAHPEKTLDAKLFYIEECEACISARQFFWREGIPFREFNAADADVRQRLMNGPARGRIPAIQVCGEWFFGFDDITERQILRLFPHPA